MNYVYFILLLFLLSLDFFFFFKYLFYSCQTDFLVLANLGGVQHMMRGEGLESENVNNLENPCHTFLPSEAFSSRSPSE